MTLIIKKLYGFVQLTGLCGVCACVYVFSLSPFLFSLHSDGSNVCFFFYTWPCLFGRTYQRRLVGASLPLPAYLSGPVQSGQMPADSLLFSFFFFFSPLLSFFLSFFQSFLFSWPAWVDCCSTSFLVFYPTSSLCVQPPCTTAAPSVSV